MVFKEGVDYEYVVNEKDKNSVHIQLNTGKYSGTTFKYGKVSIDEKDDKAYLQFGFNVIQSSIKKLDKQVDFKNYLGDLLTHIIAGNLDLDESYYDENRVDDSEESDIQ